MSDHVSMDDVAKAVDFMSKHPPTHIGSLEPIERAAFLNELRALLKANEPLRDPSAIDDFLSLVDDRLAKGATEYGDASPSRPLVDLVDEMQQEAEDIAGWACQAWRRINRLASNRTMHAEHPLVLLSTRLMQRADDEFHLWVDLRAMLIEAAKADKSA